MLIQVTILLAVLRRIWLLAPCSALAIAMITIDPISTSFWIRVTISVIAKFLLLGQKGPATFVGVLTFKKHKVNKDQVFWECVKIWSYLALLIDFTNKGQKISKWKYEVVALPKIWTKKLEEYCHKYSGQKDWTWKSNFSFKKVIKSLKYFHALDKNCSTPPIAEILWAKKMWGQLWFVGS